MTQKIGVIGIQKGQPIEILAVCSTEAIATFHKEVTFAEYSGRILIQPTDVAISDEVQAIHDVDSLIFKLEATMATSEWNKIKTELQVTNAIELLDEGEITSVEDLNLIHLSNIERGKLKATMFVYEDDTKPLSNLYNTMQQAIIQHLTQSSTAKLAKKKVKIATEAPAKAVAPTEEVSEELAVVAESDTDVATEVTAEPTPVSEPVPTPTPVAEEPVVAETPIVEEPIVAQLPPVEEAPIEEPAQVVTSPTVEEEYVPTPVPTFANLADSMAVGAEAEAGDLEGIIKNLELTNPEEVSPNEGTDDPTGSNFDAAAFDTLLDTI